MNELISVVVPIYNVEQYLSRCIESILNQTYNNIEIILVDDGSSDSCPQICDKYKEKKENILVVHQKNKGLSAARNTGIKLAHGKYICFVDSDDYINPNMLSVLHHNLVNYNCEISCCGHTDIYESGNINKNGKNVNKIEIYSSKEALRVYMYTQKIDVVAWNKLYLKELFKDIAYEEGKLFEDHFTTYKLLDKAKRIVNTTQLLYYYCKRSNSIGGTAFSVKNYQLKEAIDIERKFILSKYPDLIHDINICYVIWLVVLYDKIILSNLEDDNLLNLIRKIVLKEKKQVFFSSEISVTKKIQLYMLLGNRKMYKKFYEFFLKIKR